MAPCILISGVGGGREREIFRKWRILDATTANNNQVSVFTKNQVSVFTVFRKWRILDATTANNNQVSVFTKNQVSVFTKKVCKIYRNNVLDLFFVFVFSFLFGSPEPLGSQDELIVYPCSVVVVHNV